MIDPELRDDAPVTDARLLRQFAGLWLLFCAGLASWHLFHGHSVRALVFGALALTVGPLGLVVPEAIRPVFLALSALTRPIGVVMTRLMLGALFYVLFTPLALLFRLAGRDALGRTRADSRTTYWTPRPPVTDTRRYLRQF